MYPLRHVRLGISASEHDGADGVGFTKREVNRCVREMATAVLTQGAQVVFGHDWRPEGVMADLLQMAIAHKPLVNDPDVKTAPMTNFVPWPSKTNVSLEDQEKYRDVLHIIQMQAPRDRIMPLTATPEAAAEAALLNRVLALSEMRWELNRNITARLCFGGRTAESGGRLSGVAEEAILAIKTQTPLYLTGMVGGATTALIKALETNGHTDAETFRPRQDVATAMQARDDDFGLNDDLKLLGETTLEALRRLNRLTVKEHHRLIHAKHFGEVIGLVLTGLRRFCGSEY